MGSGMDVMAWYTHNIQADQVWALVRFIAYLFKLTSLAFAAPLFALIVFDLCLWIWRVMRPSGAHPPPAVHPNEQKAPGPFVAPVGFASTTSFGTGQASFRRPGFAANTDT